MHSTCLSLLPHNHCTAAAAVLPRPVHVNYCDVAVGTALPLWISILISSSAGEYHFEFLISLKLVNSSAPSTQFTPSSSSSSAPGLWCKLALHPQQPTSATSMEIAKNADPPCRKRSHNLSGPPITVTTNEHFCMTKSQPHVPKHTPTLGLHKILGLLLLTGFTGTTPHDNHCHQLFQQEQENPLLSREIPSSSFMPLMLLRLFPFHHLSPGPRLLYLWYYVA